MDVLVTNITTTGHLEQPIGGSNNQQRFEKSGTPEATYEETNTPITEDNLGSGIVASVVHISIIFPILGNGKQNASLTSGNWSRFLRFHDKQKVLLWTRFSLLFIDV